MRIGIDAHIILPQHKRYDPKIAQYTEQLIQHLLKADSKQEHTWVLFFDERIKDTARFQAPNVEIKQFPFVQYRQYLPVVYSHMLVSAFLRSAKLDVFHSPEGLIPFMYPGKIVTTFHYVPRGTSESNLFVRTFMLGARTAFAQLCKRARRIIVSSPADQQILTDVHGYPRERVMVMGEGTGKKVDWPERIQELMKVYKEVAKVTAAPNKKKNEKDNQASSSRTGRTSGKSRQKKKKGR